MSYSIVIPTNSAHRLRHCVASIIGAHPNLDLSKIIVVDDGAKDKYLADGHESPMTWIDGIKPFIFARNVNIGITAASNDDVIVIGDDVRLRTPGGFDLLAEAAQRKNVAAVSPGIIGPVGNRDQLLSTRGAVRETREILCFVCVYLPREWIEKIGPLDERFDAYGCEDVDWNWRAQSVGGRLMVDDRVVAAHNESGTDSAFRGQAGWESRGQDALKILRAKWPDRFDENGIVRR